MIIESREADIQRETVELFQQIKPHLDNGDSFTRALKRVGKGINTKSRWYKDIRRYVLNQGYPIKPNYRNPNYES